MNTVMRVLLLAVMLIPGVCVAALNNWDNVKEDIALTSFETGFDAGELSAIAFVESSFRADAKSGSSSAIGLFQLTAPTAAYLIETYGEEYHIGFDADLTNPRINSILGAMYLTEVRDIMENRLKRHVNLVEMYLGHHFSPYRAVRMLRSPNATLYDIYPEAAERNVSIYYKPNGKKRTVKEVYNLFAKKLHNAHSEYSAEAQYIVTLYKFRHFQSYAMAVADGQVDCNPMTYALERYNELMENIQLTGQHMLLEHIPNIHTAIYAYSSYDLSAPSGKTYKGFYV
jgi:hypothetical protein